MNRIIPLLAATITLLVSTASAQLRLVSPNGGEKYATYDTIKIVWAGVPVQQKIRIEIVVNGNKDTFAIAENVSGLSYSLFLDGHIHGEFLLRITTIGAEPPEEDVSNGVVEVVNPELQLKIVKFGEVLLGEYKDTTVAIAQNLSTTHLNIQELVISGTDEDSFTLLGPVAPIRIAGGTPVMISVRFRPTTTGDKHVAVRMRLSTIMNVYGSLDGICPDGIAKLHLTYPNGSEAFGLGDTLNFRWENNPPDNFVMLQYSPDKGTSWITIADSITGDGYQWIIPRAQSNNCLARIVPKGPVEVRGDTSDAIWKLDIPRADVYDHYDMPSAKVGESVTAVSDLFVKNRSAAKLYVESIWIEGAQASEYEIISGEAPFLLLSDQRWAVGFRFTPKEAGLRLADAVTASRDADTVRTELRGIGISETTDVPETGERPAIARASESLQMQPNPAHGDVLIQYRLNDPTRVRLMIYNSLGESIETLADGVEEAGLHAVHIDVSTLPSGMYIVELETGSGRQTQTVIVER